MLLFIAYHSSMLSDIVEGAVDYLDLERQPPACIDIDRL